MLMGHFSHVLVSCGFDAAENDPIGLCRVTPAGFAHMTYLLSSLAEGKIVLALEVCLLDLC
jgi:histone deacetylase 6